MAERKSGRSRKSINYAKFSENGDEDDDDFQIAKSPPEKRRRAEDKSESMKKKKKNKSGNDKDQGSSQVSTSSSGSQENSVKSSGRISVDDKIFERQLRVVLERSACEAHMALKKKNDDEDDDDFQSSPKLPKKKIEKKNPDNSLQKSESVSNSVLENDDASDKKDERKGVKLSEANNRLENDVSDSGISSKHGNKETDRHFSATSDDAYDIDMNENASAVKKLNDSEILRKSEEPVSVILSSENKGAEPPAQVICCTKSTPAKKNARSRQKFDAVTESGGKGPDLSPISPLKNCSSSLLPSKGLRLGLSRKVTIKSLHPDAKVYFMK